MTEKHPFMHKVPNYYMLTRTISERKPIGSDGEPTPWMTYPAICHLDQFDFSQKTVFEYGSGYSTAFWAKRAKSVFSVDNDKNWVDTVQRFNFDNVFVEFSEAENYVYSIKEQHLMM